MFTNLLFDRKKLSKNELSLSYLLKPGDYYWRVARINMQGIKGPFSDAIQCYIKKTKKPTKNPTKVDAGANKTINDQ